MVQHNFLADNGYNYNSTTGAQSDNQGYAAKALAHIIMWKEFPARNGAVGNNLLLNNRTGFSLLPNGTRKPDGSFSNPGERSLLWLSTEVNDNPDNAHNYLLRYDREFNENWSEPKQRGMAIRCIKD